MAGQWTQSAAGRAAGFCPALLICAALAGCKPAPAPADPPAVEIKTDAAVISQLAGAWTDAANAKLAAHRPDEALALLVSALAADPASAEAREMAGRILAETAWNLPAVEIEHGMRIDQVAFAAPSSLWVSVGGEANATVLWDLEALEIREVLFPVAGAPTRSVTFSDGHENMVVERGGATLLCDARTLKPIREIGPLPAEMVPASVVAFSPGGLLMAHPGQASAEDRSIVWHLRDCATGEIIRSSPPAAAGAPAPLAAALDRERLRVLHADGSLMEMPVSPVEEIKTTPMPEPVKLRRAHFSQDGNAALTLMETNPHEPPVQSIVAYADTDDGSLEPAALADRYAWSLQPDLWDGFGNDPAQAHFTVDGSVLAFPGGGRAPVETAAKLSAVAFGGGNVVASTDRGQVQIFRTIPKPLALTDTPPPTDAAPVDLAKLVTALTGVRHDAATREFVQLQPEQRVESFAEVDFTRLRGVLPALDFTPVIDAFQTVRHRKAAAEKLAPLAERIARVNLAETAWTGLAELERAFLTGERDAVLAAISAAGDKGPAAANALALALKSEQPEWIRACLATAADLPPLLRLIAESRVAWLEGRKADALSSWPQVFPVLSDIRSREDWESWEQADFQPALDNIRKCVAGELAAVKVPESSTAEQRAAVFARLNDPPTLAAIGRTRFALAALDAAMAFSAFPEETATTFELASLARKMGAPAEPCLRAEALALTALGDYQNARPRWIELITEHPVETHLPGDYAEAAYTAFENFDPRQAMEILTTGMHRFPRDGNFALRAGWVALLTGNSERAYRFLREGQRIGFPPDRIENATLLLTIAAAQSGADDDAAVYFQDLLRLDPAWADPAILDTLDWPEELESALLRFF